MSNIIQLDSHVADLIAAGEVVERPSSVIKELMENSIDAGAGIITVEIKDGGMTYIRVTDDGCGMSPEDAPVAFLRHATSKLRDAHGLEAIATLGFRGEALAAIASVSKIELITREKGAEEGTRAELEAGRIADVSPCGCPEGTTVVVRDLFYNTPARRKFMKTDRAEATSAYAAAVRCALSRPSVSVRFIKDGKSEFHTPGDTRAESCMYSLFGREFALNMLKTELDDGAVSVTGYVSPPSGTRGNRAYQYFFINGRSIRSRVLQTALERAYANSIMTGRYPTCVLYVTTGLGAVDANVHPAKTEVRFLSEKQVYDAVYYAVLGSLERNAKPSFETSAGAARMISGSVQKQTHTLSGEVKTTGKGGAFRSITAEAYAEKYTGGGFKTVTLPEASKTPQQTASAAQPVYRPSVNNTAVQAVIESPSVYVPPRTGGAVKNSGSAETPQIAEVMELAGIPNTDKPRVAGEVFNTYIVTEWRGGVWFIDKHAAHERICFDKLRAEGGTVIQQELLTPVMCRVGIEDAELLDEHAGFLEELGFTVEPLGNDAVAVRAIPSDIVLSDAENALGEICECLRQGRTPQSERRESVLKTIACKAAVKAGDITDPRELEVLAERVLAGEVTHCPHGRPVAFEVPRQALERGFKRT